uniref:Uncharacterized protein n=1 Tax=Arundo donax TaxID=35708 RepID=A0A0A9ERX7_ARUDO
MKASRERRRAQSLRKEDGVRGELRNSGRRNRKRQRF